MTMSSDPRADPVTELTASAMQMHEWFSSLREAGFTGPEAIALMGEILRPRPAGS